MDVLHNPFWTVSHGHMASVFNYGHDTPLTFTFFPSTHRPKSALDKLSEYDIRLIKLCAVCDGSDIHLPMRVAFNDMTRLLDDCATGVDSRLLELLRKTQWCGTIHGEATGLMENGDGSVSFDLTGTFDTNAKPAVFESQKAIWEFLRQFTQQLPTKWVDRIGIYTTVFIPETAELSMILARANKNASLDPRFRLPI